MKKARKNTGFLNSYVFGGLPKQGYPKLTMQY